MKWQSIAWLSLCACMGLAQAQTEEAKGGTSWYGERALADPNRPYLYYPDAAKPKGEKALPQTGAEAQAALEELQNSVKLSRALALMNPTPENIKDYIAKQEQIMDRSSMFSDQWRRALWANPELDYSLKGRPNTQMGMQAYDANRNDKTRQTIQYVADNFGLVFFVRSDCVYCHQFAPILKQLQQTYGMRVMAISLDGMGVPGYEDVLPDNGIATKLNVSVTPSLFIADTQNKRYIPLGAGFMSLQELESRFLTVYTEPGKAY